MYTSLVRIQNSFGFFTSVLFFLGGLVALTDVLAPRTPSGTLKATNVQVYAPPLAPPLGWIQS